MVAISGAAMLLASAARGGQGAVAQAAMILQFLRLTQAVYDASVAVGQARQASLLAEDTRAQTAGRIDRKDAVMAEETDGIEEAFEGQLRVLITAAGQVGERIARSREEAMMRAQAQSEQEARELQSRLAAEQRAARAELANVRRSDAGDTPDRNSGPKPQ